MKTTQSSGARPVHRKVARGFNFKSGAKAIAVEFTGQRLSPHAGSATFWAWLHPSGWIRKLAAALPHAPARSNNHLSALAKALAFMHGLLCDARKLTHVAYLRRDPLVPELLQIARVPSQATLSRFFADFGSAGTNLRCFRPLWHWCIEQLPSRREGYTLDLDSTRLLHEDGWQEGVAVGYSKRGLKPCLHPLLAVLAEVRLVAQLWLRPGNASCGNNVVAFFLDLWANLPHHVRLRGVRADAGFWLPELLALWEQLHLPYVVVAQLSQPIQRLVRGSGGTNVSGPELAAAPTPGADPPPIGGQGAGWRQAAPGGAGLSVSSAGDQSASPHHSPGRVAILQWPGGLRKRHPGTPVRLCVGDALPGVLLGERGRFITGDPHLQSQRFVPTAPGLADQGNHSQPALLAVHHGRNPQSSPRKNDHQTGRAATRKKLVELSLGQNPQPLSQLQCSRKPAGFRQLNPMKN
jgi:hypothetical protein